MGLEMKSLHRVYVDLEQNFKRKSAENTKHLKAVICFTEICFRRNLQIKQLFRCCITKRFLSFLKALLIHVPVMGMLYFMVLVFNVFT